MLYPFDKSIYLKKRLNNMGYPKNIEAGEKWALKKEEQERKIRKNNPIDGRYK